MPASLLDRRIVIVTGKGGTGKTTVSAALALAAAERGLRVLVAEVGPFEHVPGLLAEPMGTPSAALEPVGYAGREIRPGLRVMRIDPFSAVAEYIGLKIGSQHLAERALRNRALKQLLEGAPGWRELITLGKTWQLEQLRTKQGEPLYDLIIVDAPATGHGLTFLDIPNVVASAVHSGPLARNAERVELLMRDPVRTVVLPVSLAEELSTQETAELIVRVRNDLGMTIDRVVVNAIAKRAPGDDPDDLQAALLSLPSTLPLRALPRPPVLARCVDFLTSRHTLNTHYVAEIEARTGLPTTRLPLISTGIRGPDTLAELAPLLLATPTISTPASAADDRVEDVR